MEKTLGTDIADALSRFTNRMGLFGDENCEAFVDAVTRDHRTLQQQTFGLFMKCIERWSNTGSFDARNEYTIKLCKKMMEAVKDDWCGRPPMI
jgi:hypothetical protein